MQRILGFFFEGFFGILGRFFDDGLLIDGLLITDPNSLRFLRDPLGFLKQLSIEIDLVLGIFWDFFFGVPVGFLTKFLKMFDSFKIGLRFQDSLSFSRIFAVFKDPAGSFGHFLIIEDFALFGINQIPLEDLF